MSGRTQPIHINEPPTATLEEPQTLNVPGDKYTNTNTNTNIEVGETYTFLAPALEVDETTVLKRIIGHGIRIS